jgi:hypothetical protein
MKKAIWFLLLAFPSLTVFAQSDNVDEDQYDENFEFRESLDIDVSIGIGLGFDYGGIGGKLMFAPVKYVSLFGAIGYNLNGAGYNGGLVVRILPDNKVCPYVTGMYGYNAVIVIDGLSEKNRTYYGPTFGGGIELRMKNRNFWNFGLSFPLRSAEFRDDMDDLKKNPNIINLSDPAPVQISIGYHFQI